MLSVRTTCVVMLAAYSSGCAFSQVKALPPGYRAEAAPACTTSPLPARIDLIVAGVFAGLAVVAGAQAAGAAPEQQKTLTAGIPGLLLLAAPFGASAGVGYYRISECETAQGAWATAEAQREKERQERIAAQARADEERRAAQKRADEERIAAERQAEEERRAAEVRAEEERLAAQRAAEEHSVATPGDAPQVPGPGAGVPVAPVVTGPVAADGTPMFLPDRTTNPAYINPPLGYRSPEGYQKTRWGMSETEVKRIYPQAQAVGQGMGFEGETAGHKSVTAFGFSEHRLAFAGVVFDINRPTVAQYIEDYEALKKLLVQKYGTPTHDNVTWREGEELFGDAPDGLSTALRLGYAMLETQWTTGETMIRLQCEAKKYTPEISITYASLRLMSGMVQRENQAKADDL